MTDQPDRAKALEMAREAILTTDILFDGPPGPECGRFVEVESPPGTSIGGFGEWVEREAGHWALRLTREPVLARALIEAEAEVERLRKWLVHFSRENLAGDPSRWTTLTSEKLHAALRGDPAPPFHNALTGEITP